ncbi:hypothetical protein DFJ43DRAFT_1159431 [Lentinula guzmanii]|uniref:Uncharacterized protein n=2 Tax=Lentinula TaxID=5352 RepID=A0AA38MX27_9AGAR|nr:hypothetical protein DFJ43DRAFT_1159431 [Lentinula guzmanii]KAJ3738600.1 hypothetical protein DFH05DRAFT_1531235 [Lentinula detonsa]
MTGQRTGRNVPSITVDNSSLFKASLTVRVTSAHLHIPVNIRVYHLSVHTYLSWNTILQEYFHQESGKIWPGYAASDVFPLLSEGCTDTRNLGLSGCSMHGWWTECSECLSYGSCPFITLLSYWTTLFANASLRGTPPVRALFALGKQSLIGGDVSAMPVEGHFPGCGQCVPHVSSVVPVPSTTLDGLLQQKPSGSELQTDEELWK